MSAVQFKATKGERDRSLTRLRAHAVDAARDADLVVLPEMAATGYVFADREAAAAVAEPAKGTTFAALSPVARESGAWIVAGFPERAGDALFNAAMVIDPAGALAFTYRKTLLYEADTAWARPGDSGYRAIDASWGRFGVGICMDLNDDRFMGWCAASQLDVLAFPTNWIDEGEPVWPYWAWRMERVGAPLVAANTWGTEAGVAFSGRSAVLSGYTPLASGPRRGNAVLRATLC